MNKNLINVAYQKALIGNELNNEHLDSLFIQDSCAYLHFIYYLVQSLKPAISVELGVCTGRCTAHMAASNPAGKVIAIDPEQHGAFKTNTKPYHNIEFYLTRSDDLALLSRIKNNSIGLCFVDSVHALDYVMKEVSLWTPKMKPGGIFLFDDLDFDDGMRKVLSSLPFEVKENLPGLHYKGFGYAIV